MKKSKLILLLKSLDKSEIKELELFLKWNSQKGKEKCLELFRILRKYYPKFESDNITKLYCSQQLYPKQSSGLKKLTNLMSVFSTVLEEYIIVRELKNKENLKKELLIQAYKSRQLDTYFFKEVDKELKRLEVQEKRDDSYYKKRYELLKIRQEHPTYIDQKEVVEKSFSEILTNLDSFYLLKRLIFTIEICNRNYQINQDFDILWVNELQRSLEKHNTILQHSAVNFLLELLNSFSNNDYSQFQKLKEGLIKHIDFFVKGNQIDLVLFISNYTTRAFYQGYTTPEDLFFIQKFRVDQQLLIEDGFISKNHFQNIIISACGADQFEWADQFIKEYQLFLEESVKHNTVLMAKANIAFFSKKYKHALSALSKTKLMTVQDKMSGRVLQLRIYYELNESLAFHNYAIATLQAIRRNKYFSSRFKKQLLVFVKLTIQLFRIKESPLTHHDNNIQEKIESNKNLLYRKWVTEKLMELN